MPLRLLYYVSGHGFGHARRSGQVIRALLTAWPHAEVTVRTAAPARLFEPLPPGRVEPCEIDAGMAEDGPLTIDPAGTLRRLSDLVARADAIVADEVRAVGRIRPDVIAADVPFLAGDVAAATGVPCAAVSNFSWDWICDPLLGGEPAYAAVRERMRRGYANMAVVLKLPLAEVGDAFRRRIEVPLVAGRSTRDPGEVLRAIGVPPADGRARVLVGMRGGVSAASLCAAATGAADFLFLLPGERPAGALPPNVIPIGVAMAAASAPSAAPPDFADLVAASEVVVSKIGYGIVSDCIVAGARLLWPRRTGFREDDVAEAEAPAYLRMREIDRAAFAAGDWAGPLRALMSQPPPPRRMRCDGAERVAAELVRFARL